jgi:hypothetical protein
MRKQIRLVTAARAVAMVQVSANGAPSSKSPLTKQVGISNDANLSRSAV